MGVPSVMLLGTTQGTHWEPYGMLGKLAYPIGGLYDMFIIWGLKWYIWDIETHFTNVLSQKTFEGFFDKNKIK